MSSQNNVSRILLVEDDLAIMETLAVFLHYEGYEVLKARSVSRAFELLQATKPDLILLDYMLQDDTAEPVVHLVRRDFPGVPILLLTAADDPSGKSRTIGTDGFVAKPFELDALLRQVRFTLQRSETEADMPVISTRSSLESKQPPGATMWSSPVRLPDI